MKNLRVLPMKGSEIYATSVRFMAQLKTILKIDEEPYWQVLEQKRRHLKTLALSYEAMAAALDRTRKSSRHSA